MPYTPSKELRELAIPRYLTTLFLPEILSPLAHLEIDDSNFLLSLSEIEHRHRKSLGPLIHALAGIHLNQEAKLAKVTEAASGLDEEEVQVITAALTLRLSCRAVVDGEIVNPRKVIEELERRETLIQIILLLAYIPNAPAVKKRKRDILSPKNQPKEAIELLFDRLSVWQAVAELGMGNGVGEMLNDFWKDIMLKHLPTQPEICRSFHTKVFGKPYDEPSTKKPRKPKLTRARPSSDAIDHPIPAPVPMSRSISHTSDKERPRSRSASVDPVSKKPLMRAPSGKDLFKGRQVGLMRRTASAILRKEKPEMPAPSLPSLPKTGLLGRKLSERLPPQEDSNTLVFATPHKPRHGRIQPTMIPDDPYSSWAQSRVLDTPQSRASRVPDTPQTQRREEEDWDGDDPLGELMVMTDEEEDMVPDTPMK